ncbi:lysophospholipase [Candidatus Nanopelagicales bacterium]|nr:lysophospholipase [Candidatus Nanopelagicales bacterium]
MKITFMRRGVAAVAAASLITIGAPVVTAANAAEACALGTVCEGALSGSLGDAPFKIQMPEKFNGTVLVYSHGYRVATPIPAALAVPLGLNTGAYKPISYPAFAPTFRSSVAYQASNEAAIASTPVVAANLLAQGYALAGSGYARQGWAANEGVEAGENLIGYINSGAIAKTKKIMVWGNSLGGLISSTIADQNPGKVAGVLASCGTTGPMESFDTAMTVMQTWKTLIAPNLKVANYTAGAVGYGEALGDLATVVTLLGGAATTPVSPAGYPLAQANLLSGLMGGLPTKSSVYDGQTQNPAFATLGTLAALGGGFQPASAGGSTAVAMLQNVGGAAALGILGRYEMEMKVRQIGQIPPNESANFTDNVNVRYSKLLSPEQRGEFGDTLNATTVIADPLNTMLGVLDSTRGSTTARFPANPKAVAIVEGLAAPTGTYKVPTVLITTTYDTIVPAGNTSAYMEKLTASYAKQDKNTRGMFKAAAFYTIPPADGYTKFEPGAKAPNAALSVAALGNSGVGHCIYTPEQTLKAVVALNKMVNAKSAKKVVAAKRFLYSTPGVNKDRLFQPAALKQPSKTK